MKNISIAPTDRNGTSGNAILLLLFLILLYISVKITAKPMPMTRANRPLVQNNRIAKAELRAYLAHQATLTK